VAGCNFGYGEVKNLDRDIKNIFAFYEAGLSPCFLNTSLGLINFHED
jgi:hypothetical protein